MVLLESQIKPQNRIAPDFNVLWVDMKNYTLEDFKDKKWLAIIFTCNHCPYAIASWPIIKTLSDTYTDIWFVAISSNDETYVPEDGYIYMQKLSVELWLEFPYLYDETQEVAKAYDAQCTPDNYLFKNNDWKFELFFHGRFNNSRRDPSKVTERNFEEHISKLLANQQADERQTPSIWCSIKRK